MMTDELDIEALLEAPFRRKQESEKESRQEKRYHYNHRHRSRSRSRSPRRRHHRSRSRSPRRHHHRSKSPHRDDFSISASLLTEAQRDRRTVFCRQLAQRLESRALKEFCEEAGKVRDVRIVYDKVSRRSKGVAYVEFYEEESVPKAVTLTGKKLLGIPIIIELTETEKNRIAEEAALALRMEKLDQKHFVYHVHINNLHPSITGTDLKRVFQPFGDILKIQVVREDSMKSIATVHFREQTDAQQASEKMDGFELAGRPIKTLLKESPPEDLPKNPPTTSRDYLEEDDGGGDDGGDGDRMEAMLRRARDTSALKGTASNRPSPCILLQHMYDPTQETAPDWDIEIAEEVQEECSKFGRVEHLHVPKTVEGDVFVRFSSIDPAQGAVASLNGRWFGGRQIIAQFIPQDEYLQSYPRQ